MTVKNQNLFELVATFDNVARVAALRGIAHSAMAKCIGAIRQDIRDRQRLERGAEDPQADTNTETPQIDLDQRNEHDYEAAGVPEEVLNEFGFAATIPPLKLASILHAVYDIAASDIKTLAQSRWDYPLTVDEMLDFMLKNAQKLDPNVAKALAEAAGTDVETIAKMHEVQSMREREQLTEAAPEIKLTFNGFGDNGYEDCIEDLPVLLQHQLGVKVVEALGKAREQVLNRVLRTRRISELSAIPVLKAAEQEARRWVEMFEETHKDDIHEAIEAGRNVRTLEDVVTTL